MSKFDGIDHPEAGDSLALDGRGLQVFLTVLETGSVTAAANRMGVTQSAVSHSLEKLRGLLRDPLFVKSGRGIVATAHALSLAEPARRLLDDLQAFARGSHFDPAQADIVLTVAANDFQRDLLLPAFYARAVAKLRHLQLKVIPSGTPSPELLRERRCELIITPRPPEGADILQKRLLADRYACFYDAAMRAAPRNLEEYKSARHVTVVYEGNQRLDFDSRLEARGMERDIGVTVSNFSGVPVFLRGTPMLASLPGLLHRGIMAGFARAPLPFRFAELPMYLVWHRRHHDDPAHRWLRGELEAAARGVMAVMGQDDSSR